MKEWHKKNAFEEDQGAGRRNRLCEIMAIKCRCHFARRREWTASICVRAVRGFKCERDPLDLAIKRSPETFVKGVG